MVENFLLKNERLLLLGSNVNTVGIIRVAQAMGLYVIVMDNKATVQFPLFAACSSSDRHVPAFEGRVA